MRTTKSRRSVRRPEESGYAYLMALFLVLTLMVSSQVILRNLITERVSQREQEVIWRGEQYKRAIRSYYRKTGHYPQKQDDLLTGVPNLHFLRTEAMKDPLNKDEEGAWRFIYTNAAGAIIGSVKYGSMQQMALMDMNGGQLPGAKQAGAATSIDSNSQNPSASTQTSTTNAGGAGQGNPQSPTGTGFSLGLNPQQPTAQPNGGIGLAPGQVLGPLGQPTAALGAMKPTGPVDGPVIGGQLVGVGSKVDKTSVRVYKGGTKYNEWEFIWNPLEEQAQAVQQGLGGQQPGGAAGLGLGLPGLPLGPTSALPAAGNPEGGPNSGGATANPAGNSGPSGNSPPAGPQ